MTKGMHFLESETRLVGVREAKAAFAALLDGVATGEQIVICRRSQPVAALIPVSELHHFRELIRRDAELAAVLRARGYGVEPWTTAGILEAVISSMGEAR